MIRLDSKKEKKKKKKGKRKKERERERNKERKKEKENTKLQSGNLKFRQKKVIILCALEKHGC